MSGAYKYSPQHTQNQLGYSPEESMPTTTALEDLRALYERWYDLNEDFDRCRKGIKPIIEKLSREQRSEADAAYQAMLFYKERAPITHLPNCSYDMSDGPEGDYCTCRREQRFSEVQKKLAEVRALASREGGGK